MKNVGRIFFGRNAKVNVLLVLAVFSIVGLGCFGSGRNSSKTLASEFYGDWEGDDDSVIKIRNDNSGDYKKGGYTVENATVQLDEKGENLQFKFFGVSAKELKIDQSPAGNSMKLGGVVYKKSGNKNESSETKKNSVNDNRKDANSENESADNNKKTSGLKIDASKGEMPSDEQLQELTKKSLLDFSDAVRQEDFTDFHANISKVWQEETTPEKFNQSFGEFIRKRVYLDVIEPLDATFSPAPYFSKELGRETLIVEGKYPSKRPPVAFKLKYIAEDNDWKLSAISVDTTGN